MNTHEYQAREILAQYGIPFVVGRVAETPNEVLKAARELGGRVVVKAQVHAGGRGKAGGVRMAHSAEEAAEHATQLLGSDLKGHPVRRVLVTQTVPIAREYYLGALLERGGQRGIRVMASSKGGIDIEEVAKTSPKDVVKVTADPLIGLSAYQSRDLALDLDLPRDQGRRFSAIARSLFEAFTECDCSLLELNPVALTFDGDMIALDARMVVDDNALFRHPDIAVLKDINEEAPVEVEAAEMGITYVKLDGDIGCVVNGTGLAMATMDMIQLYGGEPANFLDFGGGPSVERVRSSLDLILEDKSVKAILVNIFGGITRCDIVAQALLDHIQEGKLGSMPLVVRLTGTNEAEGRELLANTDVRLAHTMSEAAEMVVKVAKQAGAVA